MDATGPTPAITSPTGTTGPTGNVTFTFTETVSNVTCNIDGLHAAACTGAGANYSFSTFGLTSAVHTVNVTATDAYRNPKTTSWTWTVDASGPTLAITSPTSGSTTGTSGSVTYTSDGTATAMTCVITPGNVHDRRHRAELQLQLRRPVRRGAHGHAAATDAYGNTTTAGPVSWTVDATGPTPAITSPTGTTGPTGNVTFTFTETVSNVTCKHRRCAFRRSCTGAGANYSFATFGLTFRPSMPR